MLSVTPIPFCSSGWPLIGPTWRFDIWSALIGAGATLLLVGLAYYFREELRLGWDAVIEPVVQLGDYLRASVEDRYRALVAEWARSQNLLAHIARLDDVFVEPEFLCPPPLPESLAEADWTEAQTLSLSQIWGGHPRLILLGSSGSGRTTVLAYVALTCANATAEVSQASGTMLEVFRERLPLYVPLSTMDWAEGDGQGEGAVEDDQASETEGEREGDSLKRLLSTAVSVVGGTQRLTSPLRQYLEAGRAIVLVDGWDELTEGEQQQATAWISELVEELPDNVWLVAAGTRGYAPLTEARFVPLMLAPWDFESIEAFAKRWVEAYTPPEEEPPVIHEVVAAELRRAARLGDSPLLLALRAFIYLSDGEAPTKRAVLFERALELLLEQDEEKEETPWLPAACRTVLGEVALELQRAKTAVIEEERIRAAIEAALPPADERPGRAIGRVLNTLTGEKGLLRPAGANLYVFTHPLWRAYLAARQLVTADPASLVDHLHDPYWSEVLSFYAELGEVGPLVEALMQGPGDLFHSRLRLLSSWASVAPKDAAWLKQAMASLARRIVQSDQYPSTRQTLAKAMAATGVPGADYFFKRALQHSDAEVRLAAMMGIGTRPTVSDLSMMDTALADESQAVREEAARTLAYMGGDAAARRLEGLFQEADDAVSAVAAEALAKYGGQESMRLLREMTEAENVMTRRAAVFGLAQLGARDLLDQLARHDEQWIVRSAATVALETLEEQAQASGVAPPPEIDQSPWLISWAASHGEGLGKGEAAWQMLRRALQEGDPLARLAAVRVLARIGRPDHVDWLRSALDDPDPGVADAAFSALGEISRRYDLWIER